MVAGAAPPPAFLAVADSVNRAPAAGPLSLTEADVATRSALLPETALLQPASATHMTAATAAQEMGMMIAFEQPCECMIMRLRRAGSGMSTSPYKQLWHKYANMDSLCR